MTIIPILSSNPPRVSITPEPQHDTPEWRERAKTYEGLINRNFRANSIIERLAEAVMFAALLGKGSFKLTWDREMYGRHGDMKISVPNRWGVFEEPGKPWYRDANMIFESVEVDPLTLFRQHPDRLNDIRELFQKNGKIEDQAGISSYRLPSMSAKTPTAPGAAASTTSTSFAEVEEMFGDDDGKTPTINLVEAWFKDDTTYEAFVELSENKRAVDGPDSPKKKHKRKPKFPKGRVVRFADKVMFTDQKNEFPGIPYFEFFYHQTPGRQYGMGAVEQAIPVQLDYNTRSNQIHDWFTYNTHPTRFFDPRTGLKKHMLTNAPDAWIPVNDINGLREFQPRPLSVAAFQSQDDLKRAIETIFGVPEVTRGLVPGQVKSGLAIEQLQEAADIRLKWPSAAIESCFKRMARFQIDMIADKYIAGIHFPAELEKEIGIKMVGGEVEEKDGQIRRVGGDKIAGHMFTIEVSAGVNQPRSKVAQELTMRWLFSQGIIDEVALLDNLRTDIEGLDEIKVRMAPIWEKNREALLAGGEQPQAVGGPLEQAG